MGNDSGAANEEDMKTKAATMVGGNLNTGGGEITSSYCLLDGFHVEDDDDDDGNDKGNDDDGKTLNMQRVSLPITSLPAILGRSHDTTNPNFFGLGPQKAISRKQAMVFYRDKDGGRVEYDPKFSIEKDGDGNEIAKGSLAYVTPDKVRRQNGDDAMDPDKLNFNTKKKTASTTNEESTDDSLDNGFFCIECLGKNRMIVDGQRVEQGHSIVLHQGSSVRISNYCLYFLLPTDAQSTKFVTAPAVMKKQNKKNSSSANNRKRPAGKGSEPSINKKAKSENEPKDASKGTSGAGTGANAYQTELDALPVEKLLIRFKDALRQDIWDRRTQVLGSSICHRAVMDAGRSMPELAAKENYSLSRKQVIDWIANSSKYSNWAKLMVTKMEERSYVSSITRSLLKAGYVRNNATGRFIRWVIPENILPRTVGKKVEGSSKDDKVDTSKPKADVDAKAKDKTDGDSKVQSEEKDDVENHNDSGKGTEEDPGPSMEVKKEIMQKNLEEEQQEDSKSNADDSEKDDDMEDTSPPVRSTSPTEEAPSTEQDHQEKDEDEGCNSDDEQDDEEEEADNDDEDEEQPDESKVTQEEGDDMEEENASEQDQEEDDSQSVE